MGKRLLISVIMMVFVAGTLAGAGETVQEVLEKVRKKYDSIADAELKFSQKTTFEMSKVEQDVTGTLWLKKTNKYRVETGDQTIVTDGVTVWSYSAANNQVLIDHFKMDENTISPEKILTGAPTEYVPTLLGADRIGSTEVLALKLEPRNEQSLVKSMKLWVDKSTWLIKKAEIVDVNGKETNYLVTDVKTNIGLQDSRFIYQVPEGAEVVDLR